MGKFIATVFFSPISQLLIGTSSIQSKWEKYLGHSTEILSPSYLDSFAKEKQDFCYINSCVLPNESVLNAIEDLNDGESLIIDGNWVALRTTKKFKSIAELLRFSSKEIYKEVKVVVLHHPEDFFKLTGQLILDESTYFNDCILPDCVLHTGKHKVLCSGDVEYEFCMLDTNDGPIILEKGVKILMGAMIKGPIYIGAGTIVKMGAKLYANSSFGNGCKLGGEINNCVFQAFSSKGHDGYLGNSVIGSWCNFGADTNGSNLKNNYSSVRIWDYRLNDFRDTYLQFCGCIVGDHTKFAINSTINTGSVFGVMCNLVSSGFLPKYVENFTWLTDEKAHDYHFDKALKTIKAVYDRRSKSLSSMDIELLFAALQYRQ